MEGTEEIYIKDNYITYTRAVPKSHEKSVMFKFYSKFLNYVKRFLQRRQSAKIRARTLLGQNKMAAPLQN